ncbi:MAG TPA: thiol reductant ABC exporter subunit CydC, partial [Solirubrobacteraceae bacterium]|nr:thiol reductant ABC exporter subunit CydC [Solirubrobacteraceae bacterium]
ASHDLALRQLGRLRLRFYRAVAPHVPGPVGRGELLSRFVADIDAVKDLYLRVAIPALVAVLVLAVASLAAWVVLPAAGAVVLGSLALAVLALPWLSGAASSRAARRQAPARARLGSQLIESVDGASELALAGRSHAHLDRLRDSDARLVRIARSDALASAAAVTAGGLLAGAGLIALLCVAIPAVHGGALSGVLLAALAFLLLAAYDGILPLAAAGRSLRSCATAAARLHEVDSRPVAVLDPSCPERAGGPGELSLEHVSFSYADDGHRVLDDLELRLAAGEHVALTGPSGAGKSTLAELLVRFNDPREGCVRLDGIDLRQLAQSDVRTNVVLCAQDSHLFNTTVRENLLIARRDATEPELLAALAAVELDEWALALPEGLDTLVGQAGELVSGGQRQRLALARALLSRARVLILDEPTAHLDAELAERTMRQALKACAGRTVLAITHDSACLDEFDRVLELRGGRLVELDRVCEPPEESGRVPESAGGRLQELGRVCAPRGERRAASRPARA